MTQNRSGVLREVLEPLDALVTECPDFIRADAGVVVHSPQEFPLPHYVFLGPPGGGEVLRLGIFANIHGDEPQSGWGLVRFLTEVLRNPQLATGFLIHAYPVCNPSGFHDRTRWSRSGKDLNREFWRDSLEPEVRFLEHQIRLHRFHGLVSLHCDDTSHGLYGFLSGHQTGSVLSAGLLEPALKAAERHLPRNQEPLIDGFPAENGILRRCYDGVLRAPANLGIEPFDITFETPQLAPEALQIEAFNAALGAILEGYRQLMAHAQNL